jgi:hypothetical protein
MFPTTKQMVTSALAGSLVFTLGQTPAFAQRPVMPMTLRMMPAQILPMPAFNSPYGNGAMPYAAGRGNSLTNPYGQYGSGMLGYGGYPMSYGMGAYSGYGAYGSAYGMPGAGFYGMPSVADYADPPDYSSNSHKESPANLETALKEGGSKPDRLSLAEKKANLRKRLERYLYLPNDESEQKSSKAP